MLMARIALVGVSAYMSLVGKVSSTQCPHPKFDHVEIIRIDGDFAIAAVFSCNGGTNDKRAVSGIAESDDYNFLLRLPPSRSGIHRFDE